MSKKTKAYIIVGIILAFLTFIAFYGYRFVADLYGTLDKKTINLDEIEKGTNT